MQILALDLARRTGFAIGRPGETPKSGSWELRRKGQDMHEEPAALARALSGIVAKEGRPDLIVVEEPLSAAAKWKGGHAQSFSLQSQFQLHGCAHGWAGVSRIPIRRVAANTVRKHLCGRASAGSRDETKAMVLRVVTMLGLVPAGTTDTDRSDAVAVWYWAETVIAHHFRMGI